MKGYRDEWCEYHVGDSLEVLKTLPAASVHCCVTSPPYWGLRSYLPTDAPEKADELGAEETPEGYVERLVAVFREVRRVLRDDGTCWLNLGDAYMGSGDGGGTKSLLRESVAFKGRPTAKRVEGFKPKDLIGLPWMVAFALRADGWYLRADVIWAKDSCMPESVRDRPTRSHEHVFLLSKRARYFYDAEAVREQWADARNGASGSTASKFVENGAKRKDGGVTQPPQVSGRNLRDVWRINPRPYPEAHYAVFPPELVYPCVKAGTSERGVCGECGAPWERVVEREVRPNVNGRGQKHNGEYYRSANVGADARDYVVKGWQPTCECRTYRVERTVSAGPGVERMELARPDVVPATVLDPFAGSGTTLYAARKLGRRGVGIDLDARNVGLFERRLGGQGVLL